MFYWINSLPSCFSPPPCPVGLNEFQTLHWAFKTFLTLTPTHLSCFELADCWHQMSQNERLWAKYAWTMFLDIWIHFLHFIAKTLIFQFKKPKAPWRKLSPGLGQGKNKMGLEHQVVPENKESQKEGGKSKLHQNNLRGPIRTIWTII